MQAFINLVIFSADIPNNKKYVLSTKEDFLEFPKFPVDNENRTTIPETIGVFVRENYLLVNDYELMPKFIRIHSSFISKEPDRLEMVFSSIVDHQSQRNEKNCFWIEFDMMNHDDPEQSELLLNSLRNL